MRYVFGDCVLDTQRYTLHRAGQSVRLRPKVFQLLAYLLVHRERVVTKQELGEQGWRGRFISDATLESTLAAVRQALGDRGRTHRYIHTLHGYGYRFVAPVEECTDRPPRVTGDARFPASDATIATSRDGPQTAAGSVPPAAVGEYAVGSLLEGPGPSIPAPTGADLGRWGAHAVAARLLGGAHRFGSGGGS